MAQFVSFPYRCEFCSPDWPGTHGSPPTALSPRAGLLALASTPCLMFSHLTPTNHFGERMPHCFWEVCLQTRALLLSCRGHPLCSVPADAWGEVGRARLPHFSSPQEKHIGRARVVAASLPAPAPPVLAFETVSGGSSVVWWTGCARLGTHPLQIGFSYLPLHKFFMVVPGHGLKEMGEDGGVSVGW